MDKNNIPHVKMREVMKLYDAVEFGILVCDASGTVIWGNKNYSRMGHFDVEKYYGRNCREISQHEYVGLPMGHYLIDIVLKTRAKRSEVVTFASDDYIITTAYPVFVDDEIKYIIYTETNYTEIANLKKELSEYTVYSQSLREQLNTATLSQNMPEGIVMSDESMVRLFNTAMRIADRDTSVLLTGETGVGKDVLAKFIHLNSDRKSAPFIHVNMATIPTHLFESELFGYTAGSFTGASSKGKAGLISLANHGTLFLDEIGELPYDMQSKLLSVIQDKQVRAVGSVDFNPVDIRIICATNKDLESMVANKLFRQDLYYRINTVELKIPPLRQRPDDVLPLLKNFLLNENTKYDTNVKFSSQAFDVLRQYDWPGNVRELKHLVESLVALCPGDYITADQLPSHIIQRALKADTIEANIASSGVSLPDAVAELEKKMISAALYANVNAVAAARQLGIDPSTLSKKRKRYGI